MDRMKPNRSPLQLGTQSNPLRNHSISEGVFGPSGATRTHGLLVPNQARYQLRYTRIFNFCHYTTAGEKNKDFSVCGHSCGQSCFCAVFGSRRKSRKRRCHKALRRFAMLCPGYSHGAPKAGALPTALHPEIPSYYNIAQSLVSCNHFLHPSPFPRIPPESLP